MSNHTIALSSVLQLEQDRPWSEKNLSLPGLSAILALTEDGSDRLRSGSNREPRQIPGGG